MFLKRITRSNFLIRLKSWEYWPFGILQFPIIVYWLWLAAKSRSLLFFTSSNPGITMGGMFGESKYEVLKKIPEKYCPKSILIKMPASVEAVLQQVSKEGFVYPLIFKPDIGERGFMVKKITGEADIATYLNQVPGDFIVQEFVDLPLEFGIFYTRLPNESSGKVTSVVMKEMLSVTGDGASSLKDLILKKDRAKLQWDKLSITYHEKLSNVPAMGERIELVSIGNHCLGTTFLDGTNLINDRLSATFDHISKQIEEFHFGRFDLRCASLVDLYEGKVKIMELNGCGAEPAHIYQPGYSIAKGLQTMFLHWKNMYEISRANMRRGFKPVRFADGYRYFKRFKALTR